MLKRNYALHNSIHQTFTYRRIYCMELFQDNYGNLFMHVHSVMQSHVPFSQNSRIQQQQRGTSDPGTDGAFVALLRLDLAYQLLPVSGCSGGGLEAANYCWWVGFVAATSDGPSLGADGNHSPQQPREVDLQLDLYMLAGAVLIDGPELLHARWCPKSSDDRLCAKSKRSYKTF